MTKIRYSLTFSNRLEVLFEGLKDACFRLRKKPFEKILLIVPSPIMKRWILERLVEDPDISVVTGIEISLIGEVLPQLLLKSSKYVLHQLPSKLEVALHIEEKLQNGSIFPQFQKMSAQNRMGMALDLAQQMMHLNEYIPHLKNPIGGSDWNQMLWKSVFSSWKPLINIIDGCEWEKNRLPSQIHLFGISHLSLARQSLFKNLSTQTDVHTWVLSPSPFLWQSRSETIENLLFVHNAKIGKDWFSLSETEGIHSDEAYLVPVLKENPLEDLPDGIIAYPCAELSVLESIQSDLTLQRTPKAPIEFHNDDSLEIHVAPSIKREVDIFYYNVVNLLKNSNIEPKNIYVLIPQIDLYLPYLKEKLESGTLKIPYEIGEISYWEESPFIQTFFLILRLVNSRWNLNEVFHLISRDQFKKTFGCTQEELTELKKSLDSQGISNWSDNHQKKWFQSISWNVSEREFLENVKYPHYFTKTPSLTDLEVHVEIIQSIQLLYEQLRDYQPRSLLEWTQWIQQIVERNLISITEEDSTAALELRRALFKLSQLDKVRNSKEIEFRSLLVLIEDVFSKQTVILREKNGNAILIQAMLPMRVIAADIIILMGINPDEFPRKNTNSSLAELIPNHTDIPTTRDLDRFLFMETLLSARKKWILSYSENGLSSVSPVIEELIRYLDQNYLIDNKLPSESVVKRHPLLAYEPNTYSAQFASSQDYRLAEILQSSKEVFSSPVFTSVKTIQLEEIPKHITLDELRRAFHHPLKFFINEKLKVYFKKPKENETFFSDFQEDESAIFDFYRWMKMYPFERVVALLDQKGSLPKYPFKEIFLEKLKGLYATYQKQLEDSHLISTDLIEVNFTLAVKTAIQNEKNKWSFPALSILYRGRQIKLTGQLASISSTSFLANSEGEFDQIVKLIPDLFFYQQLPESLSSDSICFLKNGKIFNPIPKIEIQTVLDHYFTVMDQATPLLPKWIECILKQDAVTLGELIEKSTTSSFMTDPDLYVQWACERDSAELKSSIFEYWSEYTKSLFGQFLNHENI